jgi:formate-dependent nitrite reductase membrane component NrfD
VVTVFFALELQGALTGGNIAAQRSAQDILVGRLAIAFYGGTLAIGLAVPLVLTVSATSASAVVMATVGLASAVGDFSMKLATVRAGIYVPLVSPSRRYRRT